MARWFQITLGIFAVMWATTALMIEHRSENNTAALERDRYKHITIVAPQWSSATLNIVPRNHVTKADDKHLFLPMLAAVAASESVHIAAIDLDGKSGIDNASIHEIRVALQGTYSATRTTLSDALKQPAELLVEHVNWQLATSGIGVESRVTLMQLGGSTDASDSLTRLTR